MINIIGIIAGFLLAICAIPEVFRTIKFKTVSLGWATLLLWFIGNVLNIIYILSFHNVILLLCPVPNFIATAILVYYKIHEDKT